MFIPCHIPKIRRSPIYGVYQAQVVEIIYTDDPRNSNRERLEYVVNVEGQNFENVIDIRQSGGIFDYSETVRKPVERQGAAPPEDANEYDEKLDGETVLVAFFGGHSDLPVIIGSLPHPLHPPYKKAVRADGRFHVFEYNGVEFKIDDNGSVSFEIVGKKDHVSSSATSPVILNEDAVGAKITINGLTGDILLQDSNGNIIELLGGAVNITVTGDASITTGGNALVDATGTISLKSPSNAVPGGVVVAENPANNDPITGTPLTAVGGVTADS